MNNTTALTSTASVNTFAVVLAAQAYVATSNARKVAFTAYDAATSLSKRSKSRDLLIAATKPAHDAAVAADAAAHQALVDAKVAAENVIVVNQLDAAVDAALQRASKRLDVDFHRVAGLVNVARGFRKSVEQSDWKAARSIGLDNATGDGVFDGISVSIQSGYTCAVRGFEVEFSVAYEGRDGVQKVQAFSPCRVDSEGFNLTATNVGHGAIAPHAFSRAWLAAEVLADVAKAIWSSDAIAVRGQVDAAADAVFAAAELAAKASA